LMWITTDEKSLVSNVFRSANEKRSIRRAKIRAM
jgi:hypothetical protein